MGGIMSPILKALLRINLFSRFYEDSDVHQGFFIIFLFIIPFIYWLKWKLKSDPLLAQDSLLSSAKLLYKYVCYFISIDAAADFSFLSVHMNLQIHLYSTYAKYKLELEHTFNQEDDYWFQFDTRTK